MGRAERIFWIVSKPSRYAGAKAHPGTKSHLFIREFACTVDLWRKKVNYKGVLENHACPTFNISKMQFSQLERNENTLTLRSKCQDVSGSACSYPFWLVSYLFKNSKKEVNNYIL